MQANPQTGKHVLPTKFLRVGLCAYAQMHISRVDK